jgi:hypothetical protein
MSLVKLLYSFLGGLFSGGALGLTGGGGSILAVPLLVYFVGENIHTAIGTSLIAVGTTSFISSLTYIKQSLVKFKIAFLMAVPGIICIYVASAINKMIKGPILLILFSILMFIIAVLMLKEKKDYKNFDAKDKKTNYKRIIFLGALTGFASGFFGIGGGFLLVPALFLGAKLSLKESIATSLFIIFLFGVSGFVSYEIQGRHIALDVSLFFVLGGALGGFIGAWIAKKTNPEKLRKIFAIFIIIVGMAIFTENFIKIFN